MHNVVSCRGHGLGDGLGNIESSNIHAPFHLYVVEILADKVGKSDRHKTGIWIVRGDELRLESNGIYS